MAVLELLHLLAGADPRAAFDLFRLVLVEVARTEGPSQIVNVLRQPDDEEFGDLALRVEVRAALLRRSSR